MAAEGSDGSRDSRLKKLKRLPHIFSQVLVLPLPADAPVQIEETNSAFTFVIETPDLTVNGAVKAEVLEIFSGCKKVSVEGLQGFDSTDECEFWRFRLPPSAIADETVAFYKGGLLSIIVPKTAPPICRDGGFGESERSAMVVGDVGCSFSLKESVEESRTPRVYLSMLSQYSLCAIFGTIGSLFC